MTAGGRVLYVAMLDVSVMHGGMKRTRSIVDLCSDLGYAVSLIGLGAKADLGENIDVRTLPGFGARSMLALCWQVLRRVRAEGFRTVILSSWGNPFNPWLALALHLCGVHVIYDCQDPPVETTALLHDRGLRSRIIRTTVALFDPLLAANVDAVLSVSPGVDALLRARGWKCPLYRFYNYTPLRNGDTDSQVGIAAYEHKLLRLRPGWEESTILVYSGGLQPSIRGIEEQIRAVAIAREFGANVKFAAFGWGSPEPFEEYAQELGIGDHIYFGAPISALEMRARLRESTCTAMATLPFALPTKLFEYLECGLSVFCSSETTDVLNLCGSLVQRYEGTVELGKLLAALSTKPSSSEAVESLLQRLEAENRTSVLSALSS